LLITGQSEITGEDARRLGAQEFILKPFDIPELLCVLKKYASPGWRIPEAIANAGPGACAEGSRASP
jgi:hypothetical protein